MSERFLLNAWYCAAWSDEITEQLFERTIVGESIVFYRDAEGAAVALGNACPHRSAPLSLGKLDGDVVTCPYHGLKYDRTGVCVHNPHGNGKIPSRARVCAYPLVERHAMLWIWMGDADRADPRTIPDFSCHTHPDFCLVKGVIEMDGYYELITDNLMDLTHVEFVHEGILGSEAIKRGAHEVHQDGTTIWSNRWCPNGLAPPAWDMIFNDYGKPVDHWLYMRWDAPSNMLLDVGITPTGAARGDGIWIYGTDILTPKDADSTYYFWGVTRNHAVGDADVDEKWATWIKTAFGQQDKPMIEAQQRMIRQRGGEDIGDVDAVFLRTDAGPERCRKVLRELIAQSADTVALDPRNPDLTRLLAVQADAAEVRPVV